MTQVQINLACVILQEHFGDIVKRVGKCVMQAGTLTLQTIVKESKETEESVKNAIRVLIKHNLASCEVSRGSVSYKVHVEEIIFIIHYSRYMSVAKKMFGCEGELIIREMLLQGEMTLDEILAIKNVSDKVSLKEKFSRLVQMHFVQRCPNVLPQPNVLVPTFEIKDELLYSVEDDLNDTDERPTKRTRFDNKAEEEKKQKIYWRVNFDRFQLQLRDEAIIEAVGHRIDNQAATIIETLLRLSSERTNPWHPESHAISKYELIRNLPKDLKPEIVDWYLTILIEDSSKILMKSGSEHGGMYSVKVGAVLIALAWTMADKIVEEKFTSKHCRIFRILRLKKYLEQTDIETVSMISPNDVKGLIYTLMSHNLIQMQAIPQTPEYAAQRTFFLFCVRFLQVARMLLDWCYQGCTNSILRRIHETQQNIRLLEKKQKVDDLLEVFKSQENVTQNQIEEIEELMTPPECTQLQELKRATDKLEKGELRLLNCISIFQLSIKYFYLESQT